MKLFIPLFIIFIGLVSCTLQCSKQWFEILQGLAANDLPDIQHRGVYILANMMAADKEIAEQLVTSNILEVLMALSKLNDPQRKAAALIAEQALKKAEEWNLIKPAENT